MLIIDIEVLILARTYAQQQQQQQKNGLNLGWKE